ncbi:Schwann cell myelin protein-like isoform X2 [Vanacampus margaritifer]
MSWTAQKGIVIFVILLFIAQGLATHGWGGTCTPRTSICSLRGSTVQLNCSFKYPATRNSNVKTLWFAKWPIYYHTKDLSSDPEYYGRQNSYCEKNKNWCSLTISQLRESDAKIYSFRFITNDDKYTVLPGIDLQVTAVHIEVITVEANDYYTDARLSCHTTCSPPAPWTLCLKKNGQRVGNCAPSETTKQITIRLKPGEYVNCAVKEYPLGISPFLYALKVPMVSPSDPVEVLEGHPLNLTCRTDTPTSYRWFKKTRNSDRKEYLSEGPQLVFSAIHSSDSAEYFCRVKNELGEKTSESFEVDVKYAPKFFHLWASPSNVIDEGQPVTLNCRSNANPTASYTLYKDNRPVYKKPEGLFRFNSIRPQDAGSFYCTAHNQYGVVNSSTVVIDVRYGPRLPEVSSRPSDEISVGSLVTLTCSSDANPSASYTWYKDQEESPISTAAVYNISDYQAQHDGEYRCKALNIKGWRNATLRLHAKASPLKATLVGGITAGVLLVLLLATVLLLRKKLASKAQPNANANHGGDPPDELVYSAVAFNKNAPIYSNVANAARHPDEDQDDAVEYATVKCSSHASG